jgi:D-lyxose ketol-isomerase
MKRSEINTVYREALNCFQTHGWAFPSEAPWDITDFGLSDFDHYGLTLVNLAEEPEYCEKLMYARPGQTTPAHTHAKKKEDIICRHGELVLRLWKGLPDQIEKGAAFKAKVNGKERELISGEDLILKAGERITLVPGVYHSFWAGAPETIMGEVSTANDDAHDNFFVNPDIGRYPGIEEDEAAQVHLISEGK